MAIAASGFCKCLPLTAKLHDVTSQRAVILNVTDRLQNLKCYKVDRSERVAIHNTNHTPTIYIYTFKFKLSEF
jgi:hypothetical protein